MINPRDITPLIDQPLNRLFFAINHYISTGDHFGEGIAVPEGGRVRVLIPVNVNLPQDGEDLRAFRSRFEELQSAYETALGYMGEEEGFEFWSFLIREDQADALARDLRASPGSLGWGSGKAIIDAHGWKEDHE